MLYILGVPNTAETPKTTCHIIIVITNIQTISGFVYINAAHSFIRVYIMPVICFCVCVVFIGGFNA